MIHMDTSTPVGAAQIHELVGQEELCDGLHELRADACHAHARARTHTHAHTHTHTRKRSERGALQANTGEVVRL